MPSMKKRAAPASDSGPSSKRQRGSNAVEGTAASSRPRRSFGVTAAKPTVVEKDAPTGPKSKWREPSKPVESIGERVDNPWRTAKLAGDVSEAEDKVNKETTKSNQSKPARSRSTKSPVGSSKPSLIKDDGGDVDDEAGPSFWLLKAEPESRFENGIDVKFSIDDLARKTEPEPWDGIRNYQARNNLRSMKKGELAFFYHSNCKPPGIVGIMEIVQEHSPDESAFDPKHPYYDAKTTKDNNKWSVVHVKYRTKFKTPIYLKELQGFGQDGKPLAQMQLLKSSRLSVSKVSPKEWSFILNQVGVDQEDL